MKKAIIVLVVIFFSINVSSQVSFLTTIDASGYRRVYDKPLAGIVIDSVAPNQSIEIVDYDDGYVILKGGGYLYAVWVKKTPEIENYIRAWVLEHWTCNKVWIGMQMWQFERWTGYRYPDDINVLLLDNATHETWTYELGNFKYEIYSFRNNVLESISYDK